MTTPVKKTKKSTPPVKPEKISKVEPELTSVEVSSKVRPASETKEKYYEAVGRRKSSVARIRIYTRKASDKTDKENEKAMVIVNGKDYQSYFPSILWQESVELPLRKLKSLNRFKATVKVTGGGLRGQSEAIRHGLSRALVIFDQNFSKKLRKAGFLTRDSREKERRKFGHKKARKSGQWSKR